MKRSEFLKGMIGVASVSLLPKETYVNASQIELFQCYIRGFQYYKGEAAIASLQENTTLLHLIREKDNKYDKHAIAVYINEAKLGFIPRENNYVLSKLLDANMGNIHAKVVEVNLGATPWEKLKIGVLFGNS